MPLTSPSSLLVAALVMLQRPSARNHSVASLLLKRAASDRQLSDAEREACAALADDLDDGRLAARAPGELATPPKTVMRTSGPRPISPRFTGRAG